MAIHVARGRGGPRRFVWLLVGALFLYILLGSGVRLAVEALWFHELGYLSVLETRLVSESLLGLAGFAAAFGALAATLLAAVRRSPGLRMSARGEVNLGLLQLERRVPQLALGVAALAALGFGSALADSWLTLQMFRHRVPYGTSDPVFGRDVGFYLFTLPVLRLALSWLMGLAVTAFLGAGGVYMLRGSLFGPRGLQGPALRHLGALGLGVCVLLAAHFLLSRYDVLFSTEGAVYGAGFTDVHARFPGAWVMAVASPLAGAPGLYGARR